jgi:hypothetical protein
MALAEPGNGLPDVTAKNVVLEEQYGCDPGIFVPSIAGDVVGFTIRLVRDPDG